MKTNLEEPRSFDARSLIAPLGWFTVIYLISFIGYLGGSQGLWFWYITLRRPDWGLPGWGFTVAWTVVYGVIALASWRVKQSEHSGVRTAALILLATLLSISAAWPWLFFYLHQQKGSFILAAAIAVLSLPTLILFWRVKPTAGLLLILQLAWASYVAILTLVIWQGNL